MSKLTIRSWREEDRQALVDTWAVHPAALKSENTYTFVAFEGGNIVGVTVGRDKTGDKLCTLDYIVCAPQRQDVFVALIERSAANGKALGNEYAEAVIPDDNQCTNVAATPALLVYLRNRLGMGSETIGARNVVMGGRFNRVNPRLDDILAAAKAELKRLKCTAVWE